MLVWLRAKLNREAGYGRGYRGEEDGGAAESDVGVGVGKVRSGAGDEQEKQERNMGRRATGPEARTGDQPFSFTVGDPGSLWGNITCRRGDRKRKITRLT